MLWEEQIAERRHRGASAIRKIVSRPGVQVYGDYRIAAASGKQYRVALRGPGAFDNYCACPDFAVNTLGTCKHIEGLLARLRKRLGTGLARRVYPRTRASLSLHYGDTLAIQLRLPQAPSKGLRSLAGRFFDKAGFLRIEHLRQFPRILDELRREDEDTVVYSDVLDFVERETELADGLDQERRLLAECGNGRDPFRGWLKIPLLPYQARGAIFAACRGRAILADDMGLGKTIQAIAAAEWLRRNRGIERVLVVAPASVKYQWNSEIEKFSDLSAQVIDGQMRERKKKYAAPVFFNLASYEQVRLDLDLIAGLGPDLVVLDEAQRIRNWATATARAVKQIKSRYALVLTGTPLENKLEELYSVVEFVDGRRLGPAFRFLKEHRIESPTKKLLGYRGLNQVRQRLEPILLRRTREQVLTELPARTDQVYQVRMTPEQSAPYEEQVSIVGTLAKKWQRQGWLSETDLRRLTCALQNMRMLCDSTFLYDKETNVSPKLEEFRHLIGELVCEEQRKVVVFSEYERMTRLLGAELKRLGIGFVSLHGGVPSPKRGKLMRQFREDPKCMVFLSTDAGGVGLNLQSASAVINIEPPWNPARLEQRIGRVHRLGQIRPVHVVHLLTEGSIEMRIWDLLRMKKALFAAVFDKSADSVDFAALGKRSMLHDVQELIGGPPLLAPSRAAAIASAEAEPAPAAPAAGGPPGVAAPAPVPTPDNAASSLMLAVVRFVESLPDGLAATGSANGWIATDADNRKTLKIPLPAEVTSERLVAAIGKLLRRFAASA